MDNVFIIVFIVFAALGIYLGAWVIPTSCAKIEDNIRAVHQADCAKLLRECRLDGLTGFECKTHLRQYGCNVQ